jgi:hypothetical protein
MNDLPDRPFGTERFRSQGGGIDFLGMRQVNLSILQEELIPGINNATTDIGMFCLGTWIPWKFRQLCEQDHKSFVLSRYERFREAIEVAMAFAVRDGSPGNKKLGEPRRRIGIRQRFAPPDPMTFKSAKRKDSTSLYAAPLYGPSLWFTGFIVANARAQDGSSTEIPYVADDDRTREIVTAVETSLASSADFAKVVGLQVGPTTKETLDDLALHGLHPAFYRKLSKTAKIAFIQKLLIGDGKDWMAARRRLTAALLCRTVGQHTFADSWDIRCAWYTNRLPNGKPLVIGAAVRDQRERWAVFQARQIQRTIVEGLLRSFELAVASGCRTIPQAVEHWEQRSPEPLPAILTGTFDKLVRTEAAPISKAKDFIALGRAWHERVHGNHRIYEDVEPQSDDEELVCRLQTLARWWLRMQVFLAEETQPKLLQAGEQNRISIRWFCDWLGKRLGAPIRTLLQDLYSELVFAQHVKIALARFDGQIQRLHFTLGDDGIIPTLEAQGKLGRPPGRMADRLDALVGLLCDLDILVEDDDGVLSPGLHVNLVEMPEQQRPAHRDGSASRTGAGGKLGHKKGTGTFYVLHECKRCLSPFCAPLSPLAPIRQAMFLAVDAEGNTHNASIINRVTGLASAWQPPVRPVRCNGCP